MSASKRALEEMEEQEETAWDVIARKKNFRCSVCGGLLTKDEHQCFGDRCSAHQPSWDDKD